MEDKKKIKRKRRRFAYLKNGDVISEVSTLKNFDGKILRNGGPNHYIGSFIKWAAGSEMLLISRHSINKVFVDHERHLVAKVYNTLFYRNKFSKIILEIRAFFLIFANLLKFKPEWILCAVEGGGPMLASFLVAKILQVPFVHTRHMRLDLYNPSIAKILKMKFDQRIIRNATWVLCNGPYLENQLIEIGVNKNKVIQFGLPYIDLSETIYSNNFFRKFSTYFSTINLIYVGRIEENKGVLDLLNACREILLKDIKINLLYIGAGRCLNKLKENAKKFGVAERVFCTGQLPHDEVIHFMRRCDILIIPTRQILGEGRCKSALEGLVLGLSIIVPDYGAFRYLIKNNQNGIFYEPDNIEDLRCKITELVYNPRKRKRIRKLAMETGRELVTPEKTFLDALNLAYYGR